MICSTQFNITNPFNKKESYEVSKSSEVLLENESSTVSFSMAMVGCLFSSGLDFCFSTFGTDDCPDE